MASILCVSLVMATYEVTFGRLKLFSGLQQYKSVSPKNPPFHCYGNSYIMLQMESENGLPRMMSKEKEKENIDAPMHSL